MLIHLDGRRFFCFTEKTRVVRGAQFREEMRKMNNSLARILVKAKGMNKWTPMKYLVKYQLQDFDLLKLEDEGLMLVNRRSPDGILLKLTLKGYHFSTLKDAEPCYLMFF